MKNALALIIALFTGLFMAFTVQGETRSYANDCALTLRNLINCDYSGRDLSGKELMQRNFYMARFQDAALEGTVFSRSSLVKANFQNANLYAAKFYESDLRGADLRGARLNGSWLVGADLSTVKIDEDTTFNGAAYSRKTTKLPEAFGDFPDLEAAERGMLPVRD